MKKLYILLLVLVFGNTVLWAQTQKGFNYQTVIRNSDGVVLSNTPVGIRISILHENFTGPIVYKEQFAETTNQIGLIKFVVGSGTVISGVYNAINWSLTNYFLKVELDVNNTGTYIEIGTSQLLSVPYANFAFSGSPGKSAYQSWLDMGNIGTEDDFNNTLKGSPGSDGLSTYQEWLSLGNTGTEQEFIETNKGNQGNLGLSAYDVWLSLGNIGTESDFINSLKGPSGKSSWKDTLTNIVTEKKVGIGIANPEAQFEVKSPENRSPDSALFEVKNSAGKTVFAVYENEVQVYLDKTSNSGFTIDKVDDNDTIEELVTITPTQASFYVDTSSTKATRGGFAVSGRTSNKEVGLDLLNVTPGLTEFFVNPSTTKATRGGFAVSGRTSNKGAYDIMSLTLDSTRFYLGNESGKATRGGFAVSGRTSNKGLSEEILKVTPGLTEVFVSESAAKSARGGFAVSGRTSNKSVGTFDILHVQPKSTDIYIKNDPASKELPKGFSISGYDSEFTPVELFNVTELGTVISTPLSIAPSVDTYEPDFITQTTAKSGGKVIDSANVNITAVGIIYNQTGLLDLDIEFIDPSISGKIEGNKANATNFSGLAMENLTPGQTYQVRAFATNIEGLTGYGALETFTTFTDAPKAVLFSVKDDSTNVVQNGLITVYDKGIIANSAYTDNNGETIIYLQPGDYNYNIHRFGYYDLNGTLTVTTSFSQVHIPAPMKLLGKFDFQLMVYMPDSMTPAYGAVVHIYDIGGNYSTNVFTGSNGVAYFYNQPEWVYAYEVTLNSLVSSGTINVNQGGFLSYIYLSENPIVPIEVTNPITGITWMDRNMGASQVATSPNDANAFGDLYQWGRGSDGHQLRTSAVTATISISEIPGHGNFITALGYPEDWRTTQNDNLWQGINGVNNPCPSGFRIPTLAEFNVERLSWVSSDDSGAFKSSLKLPAAGSRDFNAGVVGPGGNAGFYWTSTIDGVYAYNLYFYNQGFSALPADLSSNSRAWGNSVRCIKDNGITGSLPTITTDSVFNIAGKTATAGGNVTDVGGESITIRGLVYNTTGNPSIESNSGITYDGAFTGSFTHNLTGLIPDTTYYLRAYATNRKGTAYGNELSFTPTLLAGEVYNPITGAIWMDRNLGASQVATSYNDAAAYGDRYQWGRGDDGHQLSASGTTTTLSSSDSVGEANFITNNTGNFDWRSPQNENLWQGVNGVNNPCPGGYRLPTYNEFSAEIATWSSPDYAGAYNSPLKLPVAGYRAFYNGSLQNVGSFGHYWTSSLTNNQSWYVIFDGTGVVTTEAYRAQGFSVRCIKDEGTNGTIPTITTAAVFNWTGTTATAGGDVINVGGESITKRGVVYNTAGDPTITSNLGITDNGNATGSFISSLAGLTPLTTYYVKAYATNNKGTVYGNEVSFTTVALDEVYSSATGKIWKDRNLGASQVADSIDDSAAFGELYQWGRGADGHQLRSSSTTAILSSTDVPGHPDFIYTTTGNIDWRSTQEDNLWQGTNGINNPCPIGFRVPTNQELEYEISSWSALNATEAFNSPLKLTAAGYRVHIDGSAQFVGINGYYWTSSVDNVYGRYLYFTNAPAEARMKSDYRAKGYSIRCIKGAITVVKTAAITNITINSASSGGDVTDEGLSFVFQRGIVYDAVPNPTVYYNLGMSNNGSGIGMYTSNLTGLLPGTTYYVRAYAWNNEGITYGNEISFTTPLAIGDNYLGGIVAYILQPGDPGYDANVTHGLIAAASDQSAGIQWYNGSYLTTSATDTAIGTGNTNTSSVIAIQGAGSYAAQLCYDLSLNGYTDWYLPSKEELNKLYLNKAAIGGFANVSYWSSTEEDLNFAWLQSFLYSDQGLANKNYSIPYVRAVRSF